MADPAPVVAAEADGLGAVVTMIAAEQGRAERLITYVGTDAEGIRAELDGLEPPWADTARIVLDPTGAPAAVVVVEWDEGLGRAWILGPWVAGGDDDWATHADRLVDAALAQLPAAVTQFEVSGDVANVRLGELAARRGWAPTEPNHALVADAATVAGWPAPPGGPPDDGFRTAVAADAAAIAPLHDAEFPATYASAEQLVAGQVDGSRLVLVAPADDGGVAGYAAGQVHEDGEGFIDFVVVDPIARGSGLGRRLVQALTRQLLEWSTSAQVSLTVQEHRRAARDLYEALGFRPDGTFVAYRSWTVG